MNSKAENSYNIVVRHVGVMRFALIVAMLFLVAPPALRAFGNYVLLDIAKPFQEANYPVLGRSLALDPVTQKTVEWPAFAVDRKWWVGNDLYMEGRLCKTQPYIFKSSRMKFGYPEGPQENAKSLFQDHDGEANRNRAAVCQLWGPWVLLNADNDKFKTFFFETEHTPSHGLFDVRYTSQPIEIPPKPTPG